MCPSELEICPFYKRPGSIAIDILAPLAIKIDSEHLRPHGMFFRVCLEVAELSAALIVPRSAPSTVLKSKCWLGEVIAAVVDRGNLKHHWLYDCKHLFKGFILKRGAKNSTIAILDLKDDDIRPIKHKLSCSQLLSVKLLLESSVVLS